MKLTTAFLNKSKKDPNKYLEEEIRKIPKKPQEMGAENVGGNFEFPANLSSTNVAFVGIYFRVVAISPNQKLNEFN